LNINTTVLNIRSKWATVFPLLPLSLQLAPGNAKPPYAVLRLSSITPNEPTTTYRDWQMTGTFYLFDISDTAIIATTQTLVDAFDRGVITGIDSSLVQSAEIDVNYTDQGALWSSSVPVEFRWTT
jgi:hypothetical protein